MKPRTYDMTFCIKTNVKDIIVNMNLKEFEILEDNTEEIEEKKAIEELKSFINNNYISKDKIKEKIKKYDEWIKEGGDYVESLEAQRYALNELLEE